MNNTFLTQFLKYINVMFILKYTKIQLVVKNDLILSKVTSVNKHSIYRLITHVVYIVLNVLNTLLNIYNSDRWKSK